MTKRGSATARTKKQRRKEREQRLNHAIEKSLDREAELAYSQVDTRTTASGETEERPASWE